jgi:galactosyl transferase GMA12/MNN10 family
LSSWFDADSYLLNPNVPLEAFLPPADDPAFRNISFLGGHDHRGLNAGVLMIRVDQTALHLMSTGLALPRFRPDLKLKFAEQTALSLVLGEPASIFPASSHPEDDPPDFFARRSAIVPQRWFNAYLGERSWNGTKLQDLDGKPRKEKANSVKPGDLLVHFAGHSQEKRDRMTAFIDAAERNASAWVRPFAQTGLDEEVRRFWLRWKAEQRSERKRTRRH